MKYIDAEELKAEIRRIVEEETPISKGSDYYHGIADTADKLISFIASIQQEQPEADLDSKLSGFMNFYAYENSGEYPSAIDIARYFYELGKKDMQDQFEKNRLANCDKLTKEEYDRETDFATEIIEKEHRQPTFTDAINYGMRVMKDQMMKKAVEGTIICYNDETYSVESCCFDNKEYHHHSGDKVKLIVIKED